MSVSYFFGKLKKENTNHKHVNILMCQTHVKVSKHKLQSQLFNFRPGINIYFIVTYFGLKIKM